MDKLNFTFITLLLAMYIITYTIVLYKLPSLIKTEFYPSIAAFSFPMIIVINATKHSYLYYLNLGNNIILLRYFYIFQTVLALILTFWVLIEFVKNSSRQLKKAQP